MLLKRIDDPKLAQYTYLIGCQATGEALIVDPERDIDRYIQAVDQEDLEITAVAETHIHADFLSGTRELADRLNPDLFLSGEGTEEWQYEWLTRDEVGGSGYDAYLLSDGDTFRVGNIIVQAVHTPGHTPEHLSFLITDKGAGADEPMGMLSGDFVFVNDLGRPDLLETAAKQEGKMEPAARSLYASVQSFLDMPDYLQIWPGHGAGSACGKAQGAVPHSTAGYEKRFNPMIAAAREGEEAFVNEILRDQPEPQMYFARMKEQNKTGPPLLGSLPKPRRMTAGELLERKTTGDPLVIDTRYERSAFMELHVEGALYAPLDRKFNTVVGSLVTDATAPMVLVIEEEDVEEAVRDLVRIGYDNITGFVDVQTLHRFFERGGPSDSIEEMNFETMEQLRSEDEYEVLDVRPGSEYREGHVPGALNASYTRLPEYITDLPQETTLLVHCATGRRAAAASAYLRKNGRDVRLVNDRISSYDGLVSA